MKSKRQTKNSKRYLRKTKRFINKKKRSNRSKNQKRKQKSKSKYNMKGGVNISHLYELNDNEIKDMLKKFISAINSNGLESNNDIISGTITLSNKCPNKGGFNNKEKEQLCDLFFVNFYTFIKNNAGNIKHKEIGITSERTTETTIDFSLDFDIEDMKQKVEHYKDNKPDEDRKIKATDDFETFAKHKILPLLLDMMQNSDDDTQYGGGIVLLVVIILLFVSAAVGIAFTKKE